MLWRSGPQTVAQMARARAQSRQRLQPLVNRLAADGLVTMRPNPNHKQSRLVVLTARGERTVKGIVESEGRLRRRLETPTSTRRVREAAAVLRAVRKALEEQLPRLLRSS